MKPTAVKCLSCGSAGQQKEPLHLRISHLFELKKTEHDTSYTFLLKHKTIV